jgi:uncharacterized protein (DUF1697 family)
LGEGRYFAFLRAINTGNRRLTNEQLLAPFHELGFVEVAAYQAAGNVTFRCADTDVDAGAIDESRIEAALADAYGFATPTFVRTHAELEAIVNAAPFADADLARTAGKVQVAFLRRATPPDSIARVMALVPPEDRVVVWEREWYWLPVDGVSTSMLPAGQIESLLGEMTMRTLGTVTRMFTKFAG